MNSPPLLPTLKLDWQPVADWLSTLVSSLLERKIVFQATVDDYDYWSVRCLNDRFSLADLCLLLAHAKASKEVCVSTIPSEDLSTVCIDMGLANLLLSEILRTNWEAQLIQPEALYLIGIDPSKLIYPEGEQHGKQD
jgi:hypothetical protein